MKKLLLIRHAKAANINGIDDFERPLKQSGMEDATIMAQRLHEKGIIPQRIIASPAIRTLTTANIFSEHLAIHSVETDKKIYEASEGMLLQIINQLPDEHDFIALVGHNPGMSELLAYLTGKIKDVSTCAVALIDFEADKWSEISLNNGKIIYYDEP
jgi:phosphohistidine phosphatase